MAHALPDLSRLKPEGGKRSSKREQIVNVFLRQEGHLSADDLFDLIRKDDHRISRATVYRTLQWMVDAGIARKVDFGEGRFRFEHSYRQPRHFHLICKSCHRSFEFLSSDIEVLVEEVATARGFTPSQSVVQIYGTCEECRTGRATQRRRRPHRSGVRARRAAHRHRHRAQRPRVLHPRGAHHARRARRARCSSIWRRGREGAPRQARGALRGAAAARPAARGAAHVPVLQGRGQRHLRRGHRAPVGGQRPAGAAHRHQVRARLAPLLQEVRRAVRGVGGQGDLPRVRRRGARAPRAAHPRIPRAREASGPAAPSAPVTTPSPRAGAR